MCYTNIISIKDIIIFQKIKEKEKLLKNIMDTTVLIKRAQVLTYVDLS